MVHTRWKTRLLPGDRVVVDGPAEIEFIGFPEDGRSGAVVLVVAPESTIVMKPPRSSRRPADLTNPPESRQSE